MKELLLREFLVALGLLAIGVAGGLLILGIQVVSIRLP
jgi:hypothetical protein